MESIQRFTTDQLGLLDAASQRAEELTGDYFHLPSFGPRRYLYEVATEASTRKEERAPGAFAQLCRYVRQPPAAGDRRRAKHYYRVCLQDGDILSAMARPGVPFPLQSLLLYIMTHELIHIVRFEQFRHPFVTDPADREAEEARVHRLTYDLLAGHEDPGLSALLSYYRTHRMPRCL
jgi:hypothetical protein